MPLVDPFTDPTPDLDGASTKFYNEDNGGAALSDSGSSSTESRGSGPEDAIITLQVGEKEFKTLRSTLTGESKYFEAVLSGDERAGGGGARNAKGGGARREHAHIFVDADPGLFSYVLGYLRRGTFPLFWRRNEGFDYPRYAALLREAQFFGIEKLEKWIANAKYDDAVCEEQSVRILEPVKAMPFAPQTTFPAWTTESGVEVEFHPTWTTVKHYRCPRDIVVHDGEPEKCGKACEKAKEPGVSYYENVSVPRVFMVEKRIKFKHSVCDTVE